MKRSLLATAFLLAATGCGEEPLGRARVPKNEDTAAAPTAATPRPSGLRWKLPAGWKESAGSGMRLATLTPPAEGAEASVVALPGDSGGGLANANRWRGQLGLRPTDEAGLARSRSTLRSGAGPVTLYEFSAPGKPPTTMLAAVAKTEGMTWFFKLTGPTPAVNQARSGFKSLLTSLSPDGSR